MDSETTFNKIVLIISSVVAKLNIDHNMTGTQIAYCAEAITNSMDANVYNLSLDELNTCFELGLSGEYGEIYNRMDQAVIFSWIKKFIEIKHNVRSKMIDAGGEQARQNIYEVFQNPVMENILKDVVDKLKHKEVPVEVVPDPPAPEMSENDILIQSFMKDFDLLFFQSGHGNTNRHGVRFVTFEDKEMDVQQYVQARMGLYHIEINGF